VERLPWLGCHADGQRGEVSLIGRAVLLDAKDIISSRTTSRGDQDALAMVAMAKGETTVLNLAKNGILRIGAEYDWSDRSETE
jgi:hypothetical protein